MPDDFDDDLFTEQEDHPRSLRPYVIAAVAVLSVGALVAAGLWLTRGDDQPSTAASPSASSTSVGGPPSGRYPVTSEGVAAGGGGTMKADDGITPIGFPATCTGAVGAATAAVVALQNPVPAVKGVPGKPRRGLQRTLDYLLQTRSPEATDLGGNAWPSDSVGSVEDPKQGGYRIVSCTPGQAAVVAVFSCGKIVGSDPQAPGIDGTVLCLTGGYQMRYGGTPADWRVYADADADVLPLDAYPEGKGGVEGPLTKSQRRAILSRLPGWREYTNAPQ
ncbi:hypothetical protein PZ938_00190 [Luteipulveratus sp. YIM 133132]|uniref:hypothetical protein n=1 Tax=Luteipulveratus flavus TaxID=3031728 RepID=UPI0023B066DB|nr:hypothetical protein [Luteipulveratus sp. YIM 133132]MDE9364013.1 hypothetical protein [Luteipulveratus sp. YIM 133132]